MIGYALSYLFYWYKYKLWLVMLLGGVGMMHCNLGSYHMVEGIWCGRKKNLVIGSWKYSGTTKEEQ